MRTTCRIALVAVLVQAGCIDFGYDIEDPSELVDAGSTVDASGADSAVGVDATACVEGPTDPSDTGVQVALITLNVDQPVITISSGDVVTWTNTDSMVHTVTAGAPGAELPIELGGFDSGNIGPGAKWAYRFCTLRTAIYFCVTHPQQMKDYRVIVQE